MSVDTSEFDAVMDEFDDWLREREEYPIDPTWLEDVGRERLVEQFDVEGVDDFGREGAFQRNDPDYDDWKLRNNKSPLRMQKDGILKDAVERSEFEVESNGDTVVNTWIWSAEDDETGDDYAHQWQHEHEGDETGDRKLRFDERWLSGIVREWEKMEAARIQEIFD